MKWPLAATVLLLNPLLLNSVHAAVTAKALKCAWGEPTAGSIGGPPPVGEIGADFRPHFDGFEDTDRTGDSGVLYRDGLCYAY